MFKHISTKSSGKRKRDDKDCSDVDDEENLIAGLVWGLLDPFVNIEDESNVTNVDNSLSKNPEKVWMNWFNQYKDFKAQHGRDPKSKEKFNGQKLGRWVDTQRQRKDKLSTEYISILNEAGFVWGILEAEWNKMFELYLGFKDQFGCEPKQADKFQEKNLGEWVITQRQAYKKNKLSSEKINRLNESAFIWASWDVEWKKMFNLYLEFKDQFGCEPKQADKFQEKNLGGWVITQRMAFKNSTLSSEKFEALNNFGFVWMVRNINSSCK